MIKIISMVNFSNFLCFSKEKTKQKCLVEYHKIASLTLVSFPNKSSSKSSFSIFAPSDFAQEGSGCVSMKIPSVPTAIPALAMVSMSSGLPPVTP